MKKVRTEVLCNICEDRATHHEMLELDYDMFLCPVHHEEWKAALPTKTDEYPEITKKEYSPQDEWEYLDCYIIQALEDEEGRK